MHSLSKMPALVMNRILSNCDIRAIFSLRKVSRDLHDFIDEKTPCIHLTHVQIEVRKENICLIITNNQEAITMRYENQENGCMINNKLLIGENFMEIFAKDLALILKHQKSEILEELSIQCWDHEDWYENQSGRKTFDFLNELDNDGRESLMSFLIGKIYVAQQDQKWNTLALETYGIFPRHSISILALFQPGTLKSIKIYDPHRIRIGDNDTYTSDEDYLLDLDRIYDLPQWKKAEELNTRGFHVANGVTMECFGHFLRGNIFINKFTVEDIYNLCQIFLLSPKFENFAITMPEGPNTNFFVCQVSEYWKNGLIERFGTPAGIIEGPNNSGLVKCEWLMKSTDRSIKLDYFTPFTFNFSVNE